jgi:predicted SAM-dependent methyltransferase
MNGRQNQENLRVKVGCGETTTPGWVNLDNSVSVLISSHPLLSKAMARMGLVKPHQLHFKGVARKEGIRHARASRLHFNDNSWGVVYSSHMLEHLPRGQELTFLREALRVLAPGGILRLAVPDISIFVEQYRNHHDADRFVDRTLMAFDDSSTVARLRLLVVGARNHRWRYDGTF